MSASVTRRLPGFRFEARTPPSPETLPRMDVAVFVGFAASGPLHMPVCIEDVAQFQMIFGDDAPLCWDKSRGETVRAYLGAAVRAFFANGGRRCWVVRVARHVGAASAPANCARSNYFPIPGLAVAEFDSGGGLKQLLPAFARARSEGSWSDSLQVGSALLSRPLQLLGPVQPTGPTGKQLSLVAVVNSAKDLVAGDLLRLTFDEGYLLFLVVETAENGSDASPPVAAQSPPPTGGRSLVITASKFAWFRQSALAQEPLAPVELESYMFSSEREEAAGSPPLPRNDQLEIPDFTSQPAEVLAAFCSLDERDLLSFKLDLAPADAPAPGSFVRIAAGEEQLWLTVEEQGIGRDEGSALSESVMVAGRGWWQEMDAAFSPPASVPTGEVLNFELWCRNTEEYSVRLSDLGFEAAHPRYWANLPTDAERYRARDLNEGRAELAFDKEAVRLWQPVNEILFPLAGGAAENVCYLPLAVPILPENFLGPVKLPGTARERDGLALFDAGLFIDPALAETFTEDFMTQADFIRFLGPTPRELVGLHAALSIEEATILSVPDAVHRGWFKTAIEEAPTPEKSLPLPHPEWWHFLDCRGSRQASAQCLERDWANSLDETGIAAPQLASSEISGQPGTFLLSWAQESPPVGARYVLEESLNPDLSDSSSIYYGTDEQLAVTGRGSVDYYYRVRAEVGAETSEWSNVLALKARIPLVHEPLRANFLDCSIRVIEPPLLGASETITQTGTFTLTWEADASEEARFILEEATSADFNGAATIYSGRATYFTIYGHAVGDYFYRVRAEVGGQRSDWSAGVAVRVTQETGWNLNPLDIFTADTLLAVQRAMVRTCAGRADLFAILSLPEHYREDEAIEHVRTLKATTAQAITFDAPGLDPLNLSDATLLSFPLGQGELPGFSYSAIYHPWLVDGEQTGAARLLRRNPPDGTVCGIYAKRAMERGAWIAPANEVMRGMIALTPSILRARWLDLQESQINLIRQEPRGFLTLSADTLSDDDDLRPVGVRRLLILLRRLALKLGATYVFEPQSDSFRRLVRRGFEAMLDGMFERGAFAGKTPDTSYQVTTDSALNTAQSTEQGRFIVELKVAPSLPLTFLTVRLVQTNDRGFVSEGR